MKTGNTFYKSKSNQSDAVETFTHLLSQVKRLLQRIVASHKSLSSSSSTTSSTKKKKSKLTTTTTKAGADGYGSNFPLPDEANVALGKQLGSVYMALYFDCNCRQNDNLKSKWRDIGFDIFDNTFCGGSVDDDVGNQPSHGLAFVVNQSVITSFFNQLVKDIVSHLKENDTKDYADDNYSQVIDDICYWWIAIISHCERRMDANSLKSKRKNQYLSSILQISLRCYVTYAYYAYIHLQQFKGSNQDHQQQKQQKASLLSDTFAEKLNLNQSMNNNIDHDDDHMQLIRLYNKIESNQYRQLLIREIINTTIHQVRSNDEHSNLTITTAQVLIFMTPLIHKIISNASTSTLLDHGLNLSLYISTVISAYSILQSEYDHANINNNYIVDTSISIIAWLIQHCYEPLLQQHEKKSLQYYQNILFMVNLIHELGCQLCHITTDLIKKATSDDNSLNMSGLVQYFINIVLNRGLSFYIKLEQDTDVSICIDAMLRRVNILLSYIHSSPKTLSGGNIDISNSTMYRAITSALLSHDEHDIRLELEVCYRLVMIENKYMDKGPNTSFSSLIWASTYCLGNILSTTPAWNMDNYANELVHFAIKGLKRCDSVEKTSNFNNKDNTAMTTIAGAHCQNITIEEKLRFLTTLSKQLDRNISTTIGQAETMQFLLSLIVEATISNDMEAHEKLLSCAYATFNMVLEAQPCLGRRSLIVLKNVLELSIYRKSIRRVQQLLEFICGSVARDASCAHEIWTMISIMIYPAVASIKVQSMIMRLYPLLCNTNKRLYGRIMESIGKYVSHPNAQLRLIAASTICELAKKDLVKDVSDVIGWVQSYLTDEEDLIVHQAILCLYYLVLGGELDYVIVLKVLNKKLVKFNDNIEGILGFSDIVIETFVKFLGIGDQDDDSSESEDHESAGKKISPHVQLSIKTLCALALSEGMLTNPNLPSYEISKKYVLEQLYESLSQYSAESFGIDEDLICQDNYQEDNLYFQIRRIVDSGNSLVESCGIFKDNPLFESYVKQLTLKLEEIEQHSPVSMRWLQQHRKLS